MLIHGRGLRISARIHTADCALGLGTKRGHRRISSAIHTGIVHTAGIMIRPATGAVGTVIFHEYHLSFKVSCYSLFYVGKRKGVQDKNLFVFNMHL